MATHNVTLDIYVGGFNSPVTGPTVTVGDTITLTVTGSGVANGATATKSATSGCTAINVSVGTATANAVISFSGTSYSVTYSSTVANTATHTRTLTGTVTPAPTYSVTAPTSINEGSSGTINVTTANVADNTELYYKVEGVPYSTSNISAADFGGTVPSGPFTISSNAGSFTVTPTADLTTDGQETARVTIRTGSTSGTVVATDDFNIIDTSTTPDTTPNAFTFTDATGDFGTQQNAAVQITGIDTSTTVSRSSGAATFTVSSSATTPSSGFSGTNKSITNNQYIHIRQNCSNTYGAVLETEITVGGVSDTWSVTTNAAPSDSTPDPYSFTDATVALSTETTTSVQIQGLSATAVAERTSGAALFAVSTSGTSAPSSSNFTNADKNITNNQYLWLKQTSSSSNSTTLSSVFSVGGVSRTWNLTTVAASGGSDNYGLQIFPPTGSIARLDTSDRTMRVFALHTGTVAVGSSSTITQSGFSSSDATIGIEWQATTDNPELYSISSSGTSITISRSSSDTGGVSTYNLRIFRL